MTTYPIQIIWKYFNYIPLKQNLHVKDNFNFVFLFCVYSF